MTLVFHGTPDYNEEWVSGPALGTLPSVGLPCPNFQMKVLLHLRFYFVMWLLSLRMRDRKGVDLKGVGVGEELGGEREGK